MTRRQWKCGLVACFLLAVAAYGMGLHWGLRYPLLEGVATFACNALVLVAVHVGEWVIEFLERSQVGQGGDPQIAKRYRSG